MITSAALFGLCAAALIGMGVYGFITHSHLLRRIICFNIAGTGIFLMFGAAGYRVEELGADPLPQALIITGIVVAFSATTLAVSLILSYASSTNKTSLPEDTT